jgi:hypothetical protein
MESPLIKIAHLSESVNKHGHQRQIFFLIGQFQTNQKQESPVTAMFVNGIGFLCSGVAA